MESCVALRYANARRRCSLNLLLHEIFVSRGTPHDRRRRRLADDAHGDG